MLIILYKFLTCEGRYMVTFLYHILFHFEGGPQINFPYFLWMSLSKIVRGVKYASKKLETSVYHNGLVKLLVVHELRKRRNSWKRFLTEYFGQERKKEEGGESLATPESTKSHIG
jgi:hypothetical protein